MSGQRNAGVASVSLVNVNIWKAVREAAPQEHPTRPNTGGLHNILSHLSRMAMSTVQGLVEIQVLWQDTEMPRSVVVN